MKRTKFYFRLPTRAEWRKYSFKKNDGVLKSLEYIVHTTIIEPELQEYLELEQQRVTLTEEIGQRLVDILICLKDDLDDRIEVDIEKPIVSMNPQKSDAEELYTAFESLVLKILDKHKKILQ